MTSRRGNSYNDITCHVIDALKENNDQLHYGVPGWIPDEVRKQVDLRPTREGLSKEHINTLNQMAVMASECNRLSCDFDKWAVENKQLLLQQKDNSNHLDLLSLMHARNAISAEWSMVRRLYYTVDEHLINAMKYHQIHQDIEGVFAELKRLEIKITASLEKWNDEKDPNVLDKIKELILNDEKDQLTNNDANFFNALDDIFSQFLMLNAVSGVITDKSNKIIPVYKRVEQITDPITVTALCSFRTSKYVVSEGEPMFLLDNSKSDEWRVKNCRGEEFNVPAVTIRIPPCDVRVVKLATELHESICELWIQNEEKIRSNLLNQTVAWLKEHLHEESRFAVIFNTRKVDIDRLVNRMKEIGLHYLSKMEPFDEFTFLTDQLNTLLEQSKHEGMEDPLIVTFHKQSQPVYKCFSQYKALRIIFGPHINSRTENNFESTVVSEIEGQEIKKTVTTQSSSRSETLGEYEVKMIITGVRDLKNNVVLTLAEAKERRILKQKRGLFKNTITGERIPIGEARNNGWIIIEKETREDKNEIQNTVGLFKINEIKETRSYNIKQVVDPRNDELLELQEAIIEGILLKDEGLYVNPKTGDQMSIEDAVQCGAIIVQFVEDERRPSTAISVENTYAIYNVMDCEEDRRISFDEAVEQGILNEETGEFLNTTNGEKMFIKQAIRKGFIKARIVENEKEIESLMKSGQKISEFISP